MKSFEDLATHFGRLNEIVQTVTLACSLSMSREEVAAALRPEREGGRLRWPIEHPLDAYALEDGPQGPIPEVVRFQDFVWQGGAHSWRQGPLRRFASFTHGNAKFILIDADGGMHAYEIDEGKLHQCEVALAFARRATKGLTLCKTTALFQAGVKTGQRAASAGG